MKMSQITITHDQYMKIARTHHLTPVIVYGSLSAIMLALVFYWGQKTLGHIALLFFTGMFLWTVVEYFLHRFPFHKDIKTEPFRLITSGLHLLHHEIPNRGDYVVAPIAMSFPFYVLIVSLLCLSAQDVSNGFLLSSGLATAYLAYEWTHYATHHRVAKTRFGKYLKKHHMMHHFKDSNNYFGVTSPVWDFLFGTLPPVDTKKETKILPILSRDHA